MSKKNFFFFKKESKEKIDIEREKLRIETNNKLAVEKDKLNFEKIHKEPSYKYPADISASSRKMSAHIRGSYSLLAAIFMTGIAYWYIESEKKKLTAKDGELNDKASQLSELAAKRTEITFLHIEKQKIKKACLGEVFEKAGYFRFPTKKMIDSCVDQSKRYSECQNELARLSSEVKELEAKCNAINRGV